jgi:hypothetical protein
VAVVGGVLTRRVRGLFTSTQRVSAGTPSRAATWATFTLIAVGTAVFLILTTSGTPADSEFVFVYEAPSILAGDHPSRDFYEWGAPLSAYLSAAMQLITGYRVIGEMLLQWSLIVVGVTIAFRLGLRFSRSHVAMLVVFPIVILLLARTPTYHYSKLLCFPVAIWFGWRYLERPTTAHASLLGCWTGVSFLFRHDYVIPVGFCSALAIGLASVVHAMRRSSATIARDSLACGIAAIVVVTPWALAVYRGEGLLAYTQARTATFESAGNPYSALLRMNPFRELRPVPLPPPVPAVVVLTWASGVTESRQRELERQYGLLMLDGHDAEGRTRYRIGDVYDMRLFELKPYIRNENGFEWERLNEARQHLPSTVNAVTWLAQTAMFVAISLVASGAIGTWRSWSRRTPVDVETLQSILAGLVLVLIDGMLFREQSYVVVVAPVTAALGGRFLVRTPVAKVLAVLLLALALYAAAVSLRGVPLFERTLRQSIEAASASVAALSASPPEAANPDYTYLRECTSDGDRLMVGGMTPFYVNYYTHRPIAGGHVYWHTGWRADPTREDQSLALLTHQSVPFIVWTSDTVLEDLRRYPRILQYVAEHYRELGDAKGRILVDKRRRPVRWYGADHRPCFD